MAKLTVDQFAEKIKAQYPQYAPVDNHTLAEKMLAKFPSYTDRVDMGMVGAPPSGALITGPERTGGFWNSVANGVTDFGVGVGRTLAGAGAEVLKIGSKGVGALAGVMGNQGGAQFYNETVPGAIDTAKKAVYDQPDMVQRSETIPGKGGEFLADAALIASPTGLINKGRALIAPVSTAVRGAASTIPVVGRATGYTLEKVLQAIPEALSGFAYGKVKGQSNEDAAGTAAVFGAGSAVLGMGADAFRKFGGTLADNVGRAIGLTGKMSVKVAQERIPQATRALGLINNLAPTIKVLDRDGVETVFNPAKATFAETMQAWTKSRDYLYRAYTDLASRAGDAGAMFGARDWDSVMRAIRAETKDGTSAFKAKGDSLIRDIEQNFGTRTTQGGLEFAPISFERLQGFLEKVNKDVNPLSDKAAAEVSAAASRAMRKILDEKITQSTSGGYQQLRTAYGDLKSIENDLVNQYKKAVRQVGGQVPRYIEAFGDIDLAVAFLTGSPMHAVTGAGKIILGKLTRALRDPERNLRRAFQQMGPTKAASPGKVRAFGAPPANPENKKVDEIMDILRNPATRPAAPFDRQLPAGAIPLPGRTQPSSGIYVTSNYDDYLARQGITREQPEQILYHGTGKDSAARIREAGGFKAGNEKGLKDLTGMDVPGDRPVSLTLDEGTGKLYSGARPEGGEGELLTFSSKGLKIATPADLKKLGTNDFNTDIEKLRAAGFDGYSKNGPHDEAVETVVFNKEKLKLLPDSPAPHVGINSPEMIAMESGPKAPATTPASSLAEEAKKYASADEFIAAQPKLYHGTLEKFDKFDASKAGSNTEYANAKWGIFFSDDAQRSKEFVDIARAGSDTRPVNVMEARVEIKNPLDLTLHGIITKEDQAQVIYQVMTGKKVSPKRALKLLDEATDLGSVGDFFDELYSNVDNKKLFQKAGYDGIIAEMGRDGSNVIKEYVAFEPSQIKTQAELAEIYNKATKGNKTVASPTQGAPVVSLEAKPPKTGAPTNKGFVDPRAAAAIAAGGTAAIAATAAIPSVTQVTNAQETPQPNEPSVTVRDVTVKQSDIDELRNVLYAEISNRPEEKRKLEARVIINTALNRLKENQATGKGPQTLLEVLSQPNQYQGYRPGDEKSQYEVARSGKANRAKMAAIDEVLREMVDGSLEDTTGGAFYYVHRPDGSIIYDNKKPLYASSN